MTAPLIEQISRMSGLSETDQRLLADMKPALEKHAPAIIELFYQNLEQFERTREILHAQPGRIQALKGHLLKWLVGLAAGQYNADYYEHRYRIGYRHVEVGLEPCFVIAAMAFCRSVAVSMLIEAEYAHDPEKEDRRKALNKIMDIDLNIMLQSYDERRIQQFLEVTGFSKTLFETLMSGA